jgi:hypothetical protein
MESISAGDLVTVTTGGPSIDGIVVDALSGSKAVVALRDRVRGPVLRTVSRKALAERAEAGPDDRALQLLIRRTPAHTRGAARGPGGGGTGRGGGYTRAAPHRATGK